MLDAVMLLLPARLRRALAQMEVCWVQDFGYEDYGGEQIQLRVCARLGKCRRVGFHGLRSSWAFGRSLMIEDVDHSILPTSLHDALGCSEALLHGSDVPGPQSHCLIYQ